MSEATQPDGFALHPQLAIDTLHLVDWPLSEVRLMNDARFPWLVLIPRRSNASEVLDLPAQERVQCWEEVERAARALHGAFQPHKLNIAALGNMVPQLHLHVIARFRDDAAWPRPVWGVGAAQPYTPDGLATRTTKLQAVLSG